MDKTYISWYFYAVLVALVGVGLLAFTRFAGMPDKQFTIAVIASCGYMIWGIALHWAKKDIHPKIVIEYVVVALLAIVLLRGAIYR